MDAIKEGKEAYKSQSFDQALLELYAQGHISFQEALLNASSSSDLKMKLEFYDAQLEQENITREEFYAQERVDTDILRLKL